MIIHVTAIIPVRNGAETLAQCLQALRAQQFDGELEIVILDSDSSDKSLEIARTFSCTIISIPAGTFNHGATRNIGVDHAKGTFIYFTVQDAKMATEFELQKMLTHFTDEDLIGVTGIQAVEKREDTNPALWFKRKSMPVAEKHHYPNGSFTKLKGTELANAIAWDDVNAMYRSEALESYPFPQTAFGEDMLWAKEVLQKGEKIIRDPSVVVYHYHHMTIPYTFNISILVNCFIYINTNLKPGFPSFINLVLKRLYHIFKNKEVSFSKKIYWTAHNVNYFLAKTVATTQFYWINLISGAEGIQRKYNRITSSVPQGSIKNN